MLRKNKAKHTSQVAKGHIEESAGKVSGNHRLEAHGKADQLAGHVKQVGERFRNAIKK
ncbi:CsbD family protein [Ferrimicrobium acidiphilum]|jgi:uncharacterized protein YjbJ (UPF0337 family)|uniref:CsbD family protein n=1 Tax=Ferrimicrobium acidiphilum TaxID=121039 RepID=UPI003C6D7CAC